MTAILKAADLTQEKFLALVKNLRPDKPQVPGRIWLEAPDGWAFDWWEWQAGLAGKLRWCGAGREPIEKRAEACLTRSTAGRLFAPEGELRWRTIPALGESCWRTVFLGTTDWVEAGLEDHAEVLQQLSPNHDSFFLWGQQTEKTPDEWIELRVPHRFRYPVTDNSERVKVVVEKWTDATGEPHFVRLCELLSYSEEK